MAACHSGSSIRKKAQLSKLSCLSSGCIPPLGRLHISKFLHYCNTGLYQPAHFSPPACTCRQYLSLFSTCSVGSLQAQRNSQMIRSKRHICILHISLLPLHSNSSAKLWRLFSNQFTVQLAQRYESITQEQHSTNLLYIHRHLCMMSPDSVEVLSCVATNSECSLQAQSQKCRGLKLCSHQFRVQLAGTEVYTNDPGRWHITLFHTSKFDDTRPNPQEPAANQLCQAPAARPLPSPAALQLEKEAMQQTVANSEPLHVKVRLRLCMSR